MRFMVQRELIEEEAKNPGEIEIWGDGRQTRSYCYIDDCLEELQIDVV